MPLLTEEQHSDGSRIIYRGDPDVVAWQFTETEAVSALTKLTRGHPPLSEDARDEALERLDRLASRWEIVRTFDEAKLGAVRAHARALMLRHPLRAGDALQLAAALNYFDPPYRRGFVVIDGALADAAQAEGFTVFLPDAPKRGGRGRK